MPQARVEHGRGEPFHHYEFPVVSPIRLIDPASRQEIMARYREYVRGRQAIYRARLEGACRLAIALTRYYLRPSFI